ncbi:DNA mismatch repair ATPase msh1 [Salvia divinorum]|uniref:DNA mismatch repair ATPase msh1 n=1 Tax=Salvia divinorum TaxID=28513 RepID=A0ABD1H791_SALDI
MIDIIEKCLEPPLSTIHASSVYIMLEPDRKLYNGQTDDLQGWILSHHSKLGFPKASVLYMLVQMETPSTSSKVKVSRRLISLMETLKLWD